MKNPMVPIIAKTKKEILKILERISPNANSNEQG